MSLADADAKLLGTDYWERAGQSLAAGGDVDGDGRADLLVGAPENVDGDYRGMVSLITELPDGVSSLEEVEARLSGVEKSSRFGYALVFPGDLQGDGAGEVIISAPTTTVEDPEGYKGDVLVYDGPLSGSYRSDDADLVLEGGAVDGAGFAMESVADLDADGLQEVLIGAPGASERYDTGGAAYLLYGGGPLLSGTAGP